MKFVKFNDYSLKTQGERLRFFAKMAKGRVLDLGYSQLPNPFFEENPNIQGVYGIDILKSTNLPSKYIKTEIINLDEQSIPYPDNFFDTVVAREVIEHLEKPIWLIKEVKRSLKVGGIFLISTPSPKYYLEIILKLFNRQLVPDEHKILFSRNEIKKLLKENNFQLLDVYGYNFWIPFLKIGIILFKLPEFLSWSQIYICKKV